MTDSVRMVKVTDKVNKKLDEMKNNAINAQGFLMRNIYPMYKDAQRQRWISQGSSEGRVWDSLDSIYAKRKLKLYGSYPGAGTKMMIGT